jgi:precorrin-6A/cobalt-precorrin-6A reductase
MSGRIWLIGGTSESAKIAQAIAAQSFFCIITVTTSSAQFLYPPSPYLSLKVGALAPLAIQQFCQQEKIIAIIDASHPYALEISRTAIAIASQQQSPYLRYERPSLQSETKIIELESFATLLTGHYLLGQRVLLTVGYKTLPLFQSWHNRATLFARILPSVNSLSVASSAGFASERIIAIRPPLSIEFEQALWQHWQISLVVTKASGTAGGEEIKQIVAARLDIPLIVISRPKIIYPQQTSEVSDVLLFCCNYLNKN